MIKKIAFLFRKLLGSKGPTEEVIAFLETETDIVQLVEAPERFPSSRWICRMKPLS